MKESQDVTFPSTGANSTETAVKAFLVHPAAQEESQPHHGSVIVIHEIFGLTDHIKAVASRLAQAGYTALAIDFFTREGAVPDISQGFAPLREFVGKISDAQLMADIKAGARFLHQQPYSNQKVGIVGFCWGGRVSMLSAANVEEINAAIAYYGRISGEPTDNQPTYPIDVVAKMKAPLMGHFGAEDQGIPPAEAEKLRAALKEHDRAGEIFVYEGAGHAFNNDTRESYNAGAAKLAWERTLAWYARYLN